MGRWREAAPEPEPALPEAQRRQHSPGFELGGQCGQVLLGHRVVET